jgi:phospholipid/cholesterol/gamma-HCH transport system permease protein
MLAMLFSVMGILGGYLVAVPGLNVDDGAFWAQIQASVSWDEDVINSIIKSLVFAVTIALVALFQGVQAMPTAEGVSRATTNTVVHSSLLVLGLDFVLTALMFN